MDAQREQHDLKAPPLQLCVQLDEHWVMTSVALFISKCVIDIVLIIVAVSLSLCACAFMSRVCMGVGHALTTCLGSIFRAACVK